jgi:hypothetical protein
VRQREKREQKNNFMFVLELGGNRIRVFGYNYSFLIPFYFLNLFFNTKQMKHLKELYDFWRSTPAGHLAVSQVLLSALTGTLSLHPSHPFLSLYLSISPSLSLFVSFLPLTLP